jgi:hypothetical protein
MMTHDPKYSHVLHDRYVGDILGAFCEEKWEALLSVCRDTFSRHSSLSLYRDVLS